VLQAVPSNLSNPPRLADPTAQFYVLKDNVALFGIDITDPRQSTDSGRTPDVKFGFTATGQKEFHYATAAIAKRGRIDSPAGQALDQHFAVALDSMLISVPSIDSKTYPFGVPRSGGTDITAGLTSASARDLAIELRLGALPINLSSSRQNGCRQAVSSRAHLRAAPLHRRARQAPSSAPHQARNQATNATSPTTLAAASAQTVPVRSPFETPWVPDDVR
jgi:SecD/SecF fusion protein